MHILTSPSLLGFHPSTLWRLILVPGHFLCSRSAKKHNNACADRQGNHLAAVTPSSLTVLVFARESSLLTRRRTPIFRRYAGVTSAVEAANSRNSPHRLESDLGEGKVTAASVDHTQFLLETKHPREKFFKSKERKTKTLFALARCLRQLLEAQSARTQTRRVRAHAHRQGENNR